MSVRVVNLSWLSVQFESLMAHNFYRCSVLFSIDVITNIKYTGTLPPEAPLDTRVWSAKPDCVCRGLSWLTGSPYLHTALVHTEGQKLVCAAPSLPWCPALPLIFALRCLVCCRTRQCCVTGGNASPLSTEQLFDDGPCCPSLWFQSLQRVGMHMGLACSHNGNKSQGSGLHRIYSNSITIYRWL